MLKTVFDFVEIVKSSQRRHGPMFVFDIFNLPITFTMSFKVRNVTLPVMTNECRDY